MVFETSEYALICSLVTHNFPIKGVVFLTPQRATFQFDDSVELQIAVDSFWKNELSVEPRRFSTVQNEIKDRIRYEKMKGDKNGQ